MSIITEIILLLAAGQGFLLSILVFHKHGRLFANRLLATYMFIYSLIILNLFLGDKGFFIQYPFLLFFHLGLPFFIAPLHYLYAKNLTRTSLKFRKSDWLHFIPFLIFEVYFLMVFIQSGSEQIASQQNKALGELPFYNQLFNWVITLQVLTYMTLTLLLLKKYSRNIKNVFSTIEKVQLGWLRNITYITIFALLSFLIENIFFAIGINLTNFFTFSSIVAAISVYAIGYIGLSRSEIFDNPRFIESIKNISDTEKGNESQIFIRKYEKSGLTSEKAKKFLDQLLKLMKDEKPYKDSELTLTDLAERLSISHHNLSQILNTRLNQNFFDFINQYRIEEVKKDLADSQKKHLTILSIGLDAGFNSKTSFNTIFKKQVGITPSEYRKNIPDENQN